jgi:hypothetical protein
MLRNINKLFGAIAGERLLFFFEPSLSSYLYPLKKRTKIFSFTFPIMKPTSIQNPSASKGRVPRATIFSKQKKTFIWL